VTKPATILQYDTVHAPVKYTKHIKTYTDWILVIPIVLQDLLDIVHRILVDKGKTFTTKVDQDYIIIGIADYGT